MGGSGACLARRFQAAVGIPVFGISIGSAIFHRSPFLSFWFFLFWETIPFPDRPSLSIAGRPGPQYVGLVAGFAFPTRSCDFCLFLNVLRNRQEPVPVSMRWARSVIRTSNALHSRMLGNT